MCCLCLLLKGIIIRVLDLFKLKKCVIRFSVAVYIIQTETSNIPIHFTKNNI